MLLLGKLKAEISLKRKRAREEDAAREASSSTAIMEEDGSRGELLPLMPYQITLQTIIPRLPWSAVQTLSAVSRAWQVAVRSRAIHEERACSNSTKETFVVFNNTVSVSEGVTGIVLYSLRTGAWRQLPPIPQVKNGIPEQCECTTLDGKIYIMGGLKRSTDSTLSCQADVYTFDVAGQAQTWEKRASMHKARYAFGCGIIDGKIYVCGGSSRGACIRGTEVYDPNVDTWTKLMLMRSGRTGHKVGIVENELLVYEGFQKINQRWRGNSRLLYLNLYDNTQCLANNFEIYNPTTDTWRLVADDLRMNPAARHGQRLFVVEGDLHGITGSSVFQRDLKTNVRTPLHSIQFRNMNYWIQYRPEAPLAVLAVDDQLFAVDFWYEYQYVGTRIERGYRGHRTLALLRARGFGGKDKRIVWERVLYSLSFAGLAFPFLHILRV